MRVLIIVVASIVAGCAAPLQGPQSAAGRYVHLVDPLSGNIYAQIEMPNADGCRRVQVQALKKLPTANTAGIVHCSATSIAQQLPFRMTIRTNKAQHLVDWHFLTLAYCEGITGSKEALKDGTLVAGCAKK